MVTRLLKEEGENRMASEDSGLVLNRTYTLEEGVEDRLFDIMNPTRTITFVGDCKFLLGYKEFLYAIDNPPIHKGIGDLLIDPNFIKVRGNRITLVEFNGLSCHQVRGYLPMSVWEGEIPYQYSEFKTRLDAAQRSEERGN